MHTTALICFALLVFVTSTTAKSVRLSANGDGEAIIDLKEPFWQLNATRMLYTNQPPLANWDYVPFKSCDLVVFDESSERFIFMTDNRTRLWSIAERDIVAGANSTEGWREHPVSWLYRSATSQFVATAVASYQCLSTALTPHACSISAHKTSMSYVLFINSTVSALCSFSDLSLVCQVSTITGDLATLGRASSFRLNGLAISTSKEQITPKASIPRSAIIVATSLSLIALDAVSPTEIRSSVVPVINTTGSLAKSSNITWVSCLPRAYYERDDIRPDNFFGSSCFATSSDALCLPNICPADLVHYITVSDHDDTPVEVSPHSWERIPGVIDSRPTAGVYDPQRHEFAFGNDVCVNAMHESGTLRRIGGFHGGLPTNLITSGAWLNISCQVPNFCGDHTGGLVVFGTRRGAIVQLEGENEWKLLLGGRWLPGGADVNMTYGMHVIAMAGGRHSVIAATDSGVSAIHAVWWNCIDKARLFEETVSPRHQRSDGIFSDISLANWGDIRKPVQRPTENDGLWTSMRMAAMAFRYYASGSKDEDAREKAWLAFEGMELLVNVTGVRGLMARSAWKTESSPPGKNWVKSPTMPGWWFESTASSDEMVGHLHGYPIMYQLVASNDAERSRITRLIADITSHLVDNGLVLIDYNGKPTLWGHWDPASLNNNPFWYDARGLNSMQILAFLSSAYRITGNTTYADVFMELCQCIQQL